jgi:dihydrodipicolinate synthase/N-acetylneuraminate lyase
MDLKGICPAVATPFTERGEVDYSSYRNLLRELIRGGCHGITLFGIAGEYYKLTETEERELVKITVEECKKGKVASIVSITKHATNVAVDWARSVAEAGADCLMVLPPFFLKPNARQIYEHIRQVGQAVNIPIMVQYAPEQTGVAIDPTILVQLMREVPNIHVFKIENKPSGKYISSLIQASGNKARIFIGNAGFQMIEGLDRGAVGVVPGCSMFDVYLKIYHNYLAGNRDVAQEIHSALNAMLNHIRQDVEMIIFYEKRILMKRGIIRSDYCRPPAHSPDEYYLKLFDEHYGRLRPYLDK